MTWICSAEESEQQRVLRNQYLRQYRKRPEVAARNREYMKARRTDPKVRRTQVVAQKEWARKANDADWTRPMYWGRKVRAKKIGVEFSITQQDIRDVWPKDNICPMLGTPMIRGTLTAPSLDRINSSMGYVPGNICVVGRRANRIKNDGTAAEHRAIADYQDRMDARQTGSGD